MKLISKEVEVKYGKKILYNEKLDNYSWFNLGGPSEVFFKPHNIEDIIFFLKTVNPKKIISSMLVGLKKTSDGPPILNQL